MNIDAFILIGGRSLRFGTDKAFVEIEREPLAVRVARIVDEGLAPAQVTFVAANNDQFTPDLLHKLGRSVIFDQRPGFGAWSGLHAALSDAQSEWIFVTACDHPMISPELLKLLTLFITDDNDAIVPRQQDGWLQPLCTLYRVSSALTLVDAMSISDSHLPPVTAIFDKLKTSIIEPDEYNCLKNSNKFFLNINTSADLAT